MRPRRSLIHSRFAGLAALAFLFVTPAARAATYYVDNTTTSCSNTGAGTQANPYCTIQAALNARGVAGNTILVKPGTYRELVTVPASGTAANPIVIQATAPGVVIDCANDYTGTTKWTRLNLTNVWY